MLFVMRNILKILIKLLRYSVILFIGIIILVYGFGGGFGSVIDQSSINEVGPIIFGHRGVTRNSIENSQTSFENCSKFGLDAIELDIRLTSDNRLIVFHDDSCSRLTDIDAMVNEVSFDVLTSTYLRTPWQVSKHPILSLENFFENFSTTRYLYLDVKENNQSVADTLLFLIDKYKISESAIIANSNFLFLAYLKYKNPEIQTVLEGVSSDNQWTYYILPRDFKPDYYSSFIEDVDVGHMNFLRKNNLMDRKIVYSVNKDNLYQVYDFGIQNIILDYQEPFKSIEEIEALLFKHKQEVIE